MSASTSRSSDGQYTGAPVARASGATAPTWSMWVWVTRIASTRDAERATASIRRCGSSPGSTMIARVGAAAPHDVAVLLERADGERADVERRSAARLLALGAPVHVAVGVVDQRHVDGEHERHQQQVRPRERVRLSSTHDADRRCAAATTARASDPSRSAACRSASCAARARDAGALPVVRALLAGCRLAPGATARLDHARGVAAVLGAACVGRAMLRSVRFSLATAFSMIWRTGRSRGSRSSAGSHRAPPRHEADDLGAGDVGVRARSPRRRGERQRVRVLDVHRDLRGAARACSSIAIARTTGRPSLPALADRRGDRAARAEVAGGAQLDVEGDQRRARADERRAGTRVQAARAEVRHQLARMPIRARAPSTPPRRSSARVRPPASTPYRKHRAARARASTVGGHERLGARPPRAAFARGGRSARRRSRRRAGAGRASVARSIRATAYARPGERGGRDSVPGAPASVNTAR